MPPSPYLAAIAPGKMESAVILVDFTELPARELMEAAVM